MLLTPLRLNSSVSPTRYILPFSYLVPPSFSTSSCTTTFSSANVLLHLELTQFIQVDLDITLEYEEKAYLPLMYQVPELAIDEGPQQKT